tara:strand:+ start:751 stop:918 length:168 start_codon:yes stop_codon:yes gene_type:complete
MYGNFAAITAFTSNRLDFNTALGDFWNLDFEQPPEEEAMTPANYYLRTLHLVVDL